MLTGISNRVLGIGSEVSDDYRLRWHTIVRQIDGEVIHEVIFEPCDPNLQTGFERILRKGDIEQFKD
jgi:hypothetical protein